MLFLKNWVLVFSFNRCNGLIIYDILQFQEVQEINDPIKPPRITQNVHGYFELASERGKATGLQSNSVGLSTRLDLCNSWDKDTVASANFKTGGKKEGILHLFYHSD